MTSVDNRLHTRYPAALPVAFTLGEVVSSESAYLSNISAGGVSFKAMVALEPGMLIMLHFPVSKPVFRTPGRVTWCRQMAFEYEVGVEFVEKNENFRHRMVEVVRRVEEYRQEALRAGRTVTGQDATLEWIDLFGAEYLRTR